MLTRRVGPRVLICYRAPVRQYLDEWSERAKLAIDSVSWAAATKAVDSVRFRPGTPTAQARRGALMIAALEQLVSQPAPTGSRVLQGALRSVIDGTGAFIAPGMRPAWLRAGLLFAQPRDVIVLVADMRGFSALTNQLADTQYLTEIIDEYLSEMTQVIESHRAIVFQYTGDGFLALLVPDLVDLDAASALAQIASVAAAEMHTAFAKLHARWRREWKRRGHKTTKVGLGVGISYGSATVGLIGPSGKKFFGVLGVPVNVAAYLCSRATPGTTLVDGGSYERAGAIRPDVDVVRMRSVKLHQRIQALRFVPPGRKTPARRKRLDAVSDRDAAQAPAAG